MNNASDMTGTLMQTVISDIITSLRRRELAVFCGAGISRNSGLPLASEMIKHIVGKLPLDIAGVALVAKSHLPFEAFFDVLHTHSNIEKLLQIFDIGFPNVNHSLLARLVSHGYLTAIGTTNFDLLIERAFDKEGLKRNVDYEVHFASEHFSRATWDNGCTHLIKLHGSAEDKTLMAITIKGVANKELADTRNRAMEYLFSTGSHKTILVVGYSCSDTFDLIPQIQSMTGSKKRVLLVLHTKGTCMVHDISSDAITHPFKGYVGGRVLIGDTDVVVESIWASLFGKNTYPVLPCLTTIWPEYVDEWSSRTEGEHGKARKYEIAGHMLLAVSEYAAAIPHLRAALELCSSDDIAGRVSCLSSIANASFFLGEFPQALRQHEEAQALLSSLGDKRWESTGLGNIGLTYKAMGDFEKAKAFYEKALEITLGIGDTELWIKQMGNLGNLYRESGDYLNALMHIEMALDAARRIGDKNEEALCLDNLGNVYNIIRDYARSIECYSQARRIAVEMGNKQAQCNTHANLGVVYMGLRDYAKALEESRSGLTIARQIGNISGERTILQNMGKISLLAGHYAEAIGLYDSALRICQEIGDHRGEVICYGSIADARGMLGEYDEAIKSYHVARRIAALIEDKGEEGRVLGNIACVLARQGKYAEGIACSKTALSLLQVSLPSDHPNIRHIEKNLAMCKNALGSQQ
jgi:tetratricopeptide (TPR) repeat protein